MEASAVPRLAPTGVVALASPALLRLLSDDRLVALIREGNANAFEALYDRHHRAILSFCRHMLGCADEAEDALQHTFLAAYNDLVSSRKQIHLRAWLFTIARNRCLTILRARHDRIALDFEERATDGLATQVQRREDLRDLVIDINHLPDDQRAALVLAEIGALTHDEIGSVIGVPKGKVKALVFQARESLLASREARDADCYEIREQLATMRGGALRRTTLRRHLRECEGCRDYRHEVERQRRRVAAILPVVPTIALREAVLGATAGSGLAGASLAGGGLLGASSVLKGLGGKALLAALLAAAGTTGTILAVHDMRLRAAAPPSPHHSGSARAARAPSSLLRPASVAPSATAEGTSGVSTWNGTGTAVTGTRGRWPAGQVGNVTAPTRIHVPASGSGVAQTVPAAPAASTPAAPAAPTSTPIAVLTPISPPRAGGLSSKPLPVVPVEHRGHGPGDSPVPAPAHGDGSRPGDPGASSSSGRSPAPAGPGSGDSRGAAGPPTTGDQPTGDPGAGSGSAPGGSSTGSGSAPGDSGTGSGTAPGGTGTGTGSGSAPGDSGTGSGTSPGTAPGGSSTGSGSAGAGEAGSSSGSGAPGSGAPASGVPTKAVSGSGSSSVSASTSASVATRVRGWHPRPSARPRGATAVPAPR